MGKVPVTDRADWDASSWAGNRRRQHREFRALPFREKVAVIERLGEVADFFAERRRLRGLPRSPRRGSDATGSEGADRRP